jgi:hypothetical protein
MIILELPPNGRKKQHHFKELLKSRKERKENSKEKKTKYKEGRIRASESKFVTDCMASRSKKTP